MKKVLENIKDTELYDLVLRACPELRGEKIRDVYFKRNDYFNIIENVINGENPLLEKALNSN